MSITDDQQTDENLAERIAELEAWRDKMEAFVAVIGAASDHLSPPGARTRRPAALDLRDSAPPPPG